MQPIPLIERPKLQKIRFSTHFPPKPWRGISIFHPLLSAVLESSGSVTMIAYDSILEFKCNTFGKTNAATKRAELLDRQLDVKNGKLERKKKKKKPKQNKTNKKPPTQVLGSVSRLIE
jgi:hypothetical protein